MRSLVALAVAVLFLDGCANQSPYPSDPLSGYALAAIGGLSFIGLCLYIWEQSKDVGPDYY